MKMMMTIALEIMMTVLMMTTMADGGLATGTPLGDELDLVDADEERPNQRLLLTQLQILTIAEVVTVLTTTTLMAMQMVTTIVKSVY